MKQIKKLPLFTRVTPLEYMGNISRQLKGPDIYIKRDDLTDAALGGNKVRKLEYILADALDKGCDTIITTGGPQSNHARITAGVCAKIGLHCVLLLSGNKKEALEGNLLLDKIFGAEVRFADSWDFEKIQKMMEELAKHLTAKGHNAYPVPIGGACGLGAMGYAECFSEILEQEKVLNLKFDRIIAANGSGGTQAGLEIGKAENSSKKEILGISVLFKKEKALTAVKKEIMEGYEVLEKKSGVKMESVVIDDAYLGEGYAVPDARVLEAIGLVGRAEGIVLDPVYTGKAFGGLIDYIRLGKIGKDEKILFLHTGGYPGMVNMTEKHKKYFENF